MNIKEKIKSSRVYFDGSMGVMLQSLGLEPGELPENWNLTHPEKIVNLHKAYLEAGCNIILLELTSSSSQILIKL